MGNVFSQFDTTPSGWVAAVKTAIDASSNWSNITGDIMKAVGSDGQEMVVNLNKSAVSALRQPISFWRSHNGTTGTDEKTPLYHFWKATGGATTDPIHVTVGAGPDHLFVRTEGSRAGETGAESSTLGSMASSFFLGSLEPYFNTTQDPQFTVVVVGPHLADGSNAGSIPIYIGRNAANSQSWGTGYLTTLTGSSVEGNQQQHNHKLIGLDGNYYLKPWVVESVLDGIRGRLRSCYFAGHGVGQLDQSVTSDYVSEGELFTIGGVTYRICAVGRAGGSSVNYLMGWGWHNGTVNTRSFHAPMVAIPVS